MISKYFKDLGSNFARAKADKTTVEAPSSDLGAATPETAAHGASHDNEKLPVAVSGGLVHSSSQIYESTGSDVLFIPEIAPGQSVHVYHSGGDEFTIEIPENNDSLQAKFEGQTVRIQPGDIITGRGSITFQRAPDADGQIAETKRIGVVSKPGGNDGPGF